MTSFVASSALVRTASVLSLFLLVLGGCGRSQPDLKLVSRESWPQVLAAERGRIVVVNVWAGWCRPCVEFLPYFVRLRDKYEPLGVRFLTLCLDDYGDRATVEASKRILVEQDATLPNYLLEADVEKAFGWLGLDGVPVVLVYDHAGAPRYKLATGPFENAIDVIDVEDAIESLREPE
jgi:thiol-disulfide isomerase/thioredoxin